MPGYKLIAALIVFIAALQPCFANDNAKIQGAWKLVSYEVEVQSSGGGALSPSQKK